LIGPLIPEHRRRVVKLMGDGALVEFASAVALRDRDHLAKSPRHERLAMRDPRT
jgi:class 3 adenylate cyclase